MIDEKWFKGFVESYRCRICKKDLNLENLGGFGENHMIFCKDCKHGYERRILQKVNTDVS